MHDPPAGRRVPPPLLDSLGRELADLRVSVTDRCNFRCRYCMPRERFGSEHRFLDRSDLLSFEEITRLASIFVSLGVGKIRLTGGEPLLRRGLPKLVSMLASLGTDLALTTNGSLLSRHADALAAAGLRRITVSLDALDEETFQQMSDSAVSVADVLAGITAAERAGLSPLKLNVVVRRGLNEHAIGAMVDRFAGSGHVVRFIEYMDVGTTNGWRLDHVLTAEEILSVVRTRTGLEPIAPDRPGEVASRYRRIDGGGEIGVIASVSRPFCRDCVRARLSSDGRLHTCLFSTGGTALGYALRHGVPDSQIASMIRSAWHLRDDRYSELRSDATRPSAAVPVTLAGSAERAGRPTPAPGAEKVEMSYIGG